MIEIEIDKQPIIDGIKQGIQFALDSIASDPVGDLLLAIAIALAIVSLASFGFHKLVRWLREEVF